MINLKTIFSAVLISTTLTTYSQYTATQLHDLPEPISNNAVTGYLDDTERFVYTFGGIDATKSPSGIHNRCYKYNATFDTWVVLPNLPQSPTRIAASASTIDDTIYIIGGYHVFNNGNEQSSNLIHRFHVMADTFLTNGSPLPKATDDHVQAVYKDSLIFVVSGWSQSLNIPDVQIYNPKSNTWLIGTSVPNNHEFKSFGASGVIIGDTIYYFGGAKMGANFPIQNQLRKGYINPINVTDISWTLDTIHPDLVGYRMAAFSDGNVIRWIGGANATYNYNGIGYAGNIPVEPNRRILSFYPKTNTWDTTSLPEINMDFRGVASFGTQAILVGGMDANQKVSKRTIQIDYTPNSINTVTSIQNSFSIYPNPASQLLYLEHNSKFSQVNIYTSTGQLIFQDLNHQNQPINIQHLKNGIYFIIAKSNESITSQKLIIKH